MSTAKEVLVKVRLYEGTYIARAGKGGASVKITSSMSGPIAAQKAAAKFFQVEFGRVTLAKDSPGVFRATVIGANGQNTVNSPVCAPIFGSSNSLSDVLMPQSIGESEGQRTKVVSIPKAPN